MLRLVVIITQYFNLIKVRASLKINAVSGIFVKLMVPDVEQASNSITPENYHLPPQANDKLMTFPPIDLQMSRPPVGANTPDTFYSHGVEETGIGVTKMSPEPACHGGCDNLSAWSVYTTLLFQLETAAIFQNGA